MYDKIKTCDGKILHLQKYLFFKNNSGESIVDSKILMNELIRGHKESNSDMNYNRFLPAVRRWTGL